MSEVDIETKQVIQKAILGGTDKVSTPEGKVGSINDMLVTMLENREKSNKEEQEALSENRKVALGVVNTSLIGKLYE